MQQQQQQQHVVLLLLRHAHVVALQCWKGWIACMPVICNVLLRPCTTLQALSAQLDVNVQTFARLAHMPPAIVCVTAPRASCCRCRLLIAPFPGRTGKSEYVQGLTVEECATLLNIDANNKDLMDMVYDTAFAIKNRIYGNRIVLFAPLYIANYCVNSCTYCAFRAGNKGLQV
jgi:hypothetical protein